MRLQFSLRLFLASFTFLAILVGCVTRVIVSVKEQVRRHKTAIVKLNEQYVFIREGNAPPRSTRFQVFARRWIDQDAYGTASSCEIGNPGFARLSSADVEQKLEILKEVHGVPRLSIAVEELTVKAVKLLRTQTELLQLDIDCESFENGALAELRHFKSLIALNIHSKPSLELLPAVRYLPRLKHLSLNIEGLDNSSVVALRDFAVLECICFRGAASPTPFLDSLAKSSRLAQVELHETPLNTEATMALSRISSLRRVVICSGPLPDQFLAEFARLRNLESVFVSTYDSINRDSSAPALASCPMLKAIYLDGLKFTEKDLLAFHSHPALVKLTFRGKMPESDIEQFLKATPKCEVAVVPIGSSMFGLGDGTFSSSSGGNAYRWLDGKMQSKSLQFGGGNWR